MLIELNYVFISYIEGISYVGGLLGSFRSENIYQEIQLCICNHLNIGALDSFCNCFTGYNF
jgi:hypothetical protein